MHVENETKNKEKLRIKRLQISRDSDPSFEEDRPDQDLFPDPGPIKNHQPICSFSVRIFLRLQ
jgi:hypothetical protein